LRISINVLPTDGGGNLAGIFDRTNAYILSQAQALPVEAMAPPKDKPKRIFFALPGMLDKIKARQVTCTYRPNARNGLYEVHTGSRFDAKPTGIIIEVYQTEAVETAKLKDSDAQLAGVASARELLEHLDRWYDGVPSTITRNWFRLVE